MITTCTTFLDRLLRATQRGIGAGFGIESSLDFYRNKVPESHSLSQRCVITLWFLSHVME